MDRFALHIRLHFIPAPLASMFVVFSLALAGWVAIELGAARVAAVSIVGAAGVLVVLLLLQAPIPRNLQDLRDRRSIALLCPLAGGEGPELAGGPASGRSLVGGGGHAATGGTGFVLGASLSAGGALVVVHRRRQVRAKAGAAAAIGAFALGAAGFAHMALVAPHWSDRPVLGIGFAAVAAGQVAAAASMAARPGRRVAMFCAGAAGAPTMVYAATRLAAVPGAGGPEAVDAIGLVVQVLQVGGAAAAVAWCLLASPALQRPVSASAA